jgi:hypothetical protein
MGTPNVDTTSDVTITKKYSLLSSVASRVACCFCCCLSPNIACKLQCRALLALLLLPPFTPAPPLH